jgi:hypothetical protein
VLQWKTISCSYFEIVQSEYFIYWIQCSDWLFLNYEYKNHTGKFDDPKTRDQTNDVFWTGGELANYNRSYCKQGNAMSILFDLLQISLEKNRLFRLRRT